MKKVFFSHKKDDEEKMKLLNEKTVKIGDRPLEDSKSVLNDITMVDMVTQN